MERIRLENNPGHWWHNKVTGLYCRNAFLSVTEDRLNWELVTDQYKQEHEQQEDEPEPTDTPLIP